MRQTKDLCLVIPMSRGDDAVDEVGKAAMAYAHHVPVSMKVFQAWHLLCAKTFTEIMAQGLGVAGGPRVAAEILKRQAEIAQVWEGQEGAEQGLWGEMLRNTNAIVQDPKGVWITLPWEQAKLMDNLLFEEDVMEVENALAFFSLGWRMNKRDRRERPMRGGTALWGGQLTSSSSTEYITFLKTQTKPENTGEPSPAPTVPTSPSPQPT